MAGRAGRGRSAGLCRRARAWRRMRTDSLSQRQGSLLDPISFLIYHFRVLGAEVVKALMRAGWQVVRIRGSHHLREKGDRVVAVPVHARRDLGIGLLRAIEKQTGVKLR